MFHPPERYTYIRANSTRPLWPYGPQVREYTMGPGHPHDTHVAQAVTRLVATPSDAEIVSAVTRLVATPSDAEIVSAVTRLVATPSDAEIRYNMGHLYSVPSSVGSESDDGSYQAPDVEPPLVPPLGPPPVPPLVPPPVGAISDSEESEGSSVLSDGGSSVLSDDDRELVSDEEIQERAHRIVKKYNGKHHGSFEKALLIIGDGAYMGDILAMTLCCMPWTNGKKNAFSSLRDETFDILHERINYIYLASEDRYPDTKRAEQIAQITDTSSNFQEIISWNGFGEGDRMNLQYTPMACLWAHESNVDEVEILTSRRDLMLGRKEDGDFNDNMMDAFGELDISLGGSIAAEAEYIIKMSAINRCLLCEDTSVPPKSHYPQFTGAITSAAYMASRSPKILVPKSIEGFDLVDKKNNHGLDIVIPKVAHTIEGWSYGEVETLRKGSLVMTLDGFPSQRSFVGQMIPLWKDIQRLKGVTDDPDEDFNIVLDAVLSEIKEFTKKANSKITKSSYDEDLLFRSVCPVRNPYSPEKYPFFEAAVDAGEHTGVLQRLLTPDEIREAGHVESVFWKNTDFTWRGATVGESDDPIIRGFDELIALLGEDMCNSIVFDQTPNNGNWMETMISAINGILGLKEVMLYELLYFMRLYREWIERGGAQNEPVAVGRWFNKAPNRDRELAIINAHVDSDETAKVFQSIRSIIRVPINGPNDYEYGYQLQFPQENQSFADIMEMGNGLGQFPWGMSAPLLEKDDTIEWIPRTCYTTQEHFEIGARVRLAQGVEGDSDVTRGNTSFNNSGVVMASSEDLGVSYVDFDGPEEANGKSYVLFRNTDLVPDNGDHDRDWPISVGGVVVSPQYSRIITAVNGEKHLSFHEMSMIIGKVEKNSRRIIISACRGDQLLVGEAEQEFFDLKDSWTEGRPWEEVMGKIIQNNINKIEPSFYSREHDKISLCLYSYLFEYPTVRDENGLHMILKQQYGDKKIKEIKRVLGGDNADYPGYRNLKGTISIADTSSMKWYLSLLNIGLTDGNDWTHITGILKKYYGSRVDRRHFTRRWGERFEFNCFRGQPPDPLIERIRLWDYGGGGPIQLPEIDVDEGPLGGLSWAQLLDTVSGGAEIAEIAEIAGLVQHGGQRVSDSLHGNGRTKRRTERRTERHDMRSGLSKKKRRYLPPGRSTRRQDRPRRTVRKRGKRDLLS